eukprot:PhF_6_TR35367/c0_g1_i1/m.51357
MVSSFCAEAVGGINFYELGYIIIAAINLLCIFLCCAFHWRSARQVRNLQKRLAHAQYNNMGKNGNDGILTLHSQPPNSNVGSYNPNHNADFSEISAVSMIAATPTGKVPPRMLPPGSATPPMTARGPQPPPSQTPRSMKGPPPPPPAAPLNDTAQHFFSISVPGFEDNFLLRLRTTSKLDRLLETLPSKQGCESTLWVNGSPIDLKKSGFEMGFPTGVNSVIQLELRYNQLLGMPGTRSPSVTLLESHTITDQSSHHRGGGGGVMNTRNVNRNGPPSSTEEGGLYRPSKGVIVRNHANMISGSSNGMLLPWCENDEGCDEINIPSHYRRFRHTCRIDNCENLSNPDHVRYFEHSVGGEGGRKHPRSPMLSPSTSSTAPLALSPRRDRPVCPKNGFCPDVNEDWHQQQWLHTCALFPCPAIYDDDHTMRFLHNDEHRLPAPPLCPS